MSICQPMHSHRMAILDRGTEAAPNSVRLKPEDVAVSAPGSDLQRSTL
jgi:hypothetical protein